MLSRWNFYRAIVLANTRLHAPGLYRPCASYSVCLAKERTLGLDRRPAHQPCYGHDRVNENRAMSRCYSSGEQPQLPPAPPENVPENVKESLSIFQRFKNMAKKYWYIVLPVHLVTSALWLGSFYFIASSGVDVPALLESLRFPNWIIDKVKNGHSWTSYLVIAYGLYKIFTPLRYMVTLGGSTVVIRYLQRIGYLKKDLPSPKKP